jgi:hypothetical protein
MAKNRNIFLFWYGYVLQNTARFCQPQATPGWRAVEAKLVGNSLLNLADGFFNSGKVSELMRFIFCVE